MECERRVLHLFTVAINYMARYSYLGVKPLTTIGDVGTIESTVGTECESSGINNCELVFSNRGL